MHRFYKRVCLHISNEMVEKTANSNEDLVLDTSATFSSVKNKKLMTNVHEVEEPKRLCAPMLVKERWITWEKFWD